MPERSHKEHGGVRELFMGKVSQKNLLNGSGVLSSVANALPCAAQSSWVEPTRATLDSVDAPKEHHHAESLPAFRSHRRPIYRCNTNSPSRADSMQSTSGSEPFADTAAHRPGCGELFGILIGSIHWHLTGPSGGPGTAARVSRLSRIKLRRNFVSEKKTIAERE